MEVILFESHAANNTDNYKDNNSFSDSIISNRKLIISKDRK